jgi:hypothetical protein
MLVHFDSAVGEFTMNGEVAVTLLKMMGHTGTVPSAILAADIPKALERLKAALAALPPSKSAGTEDETKRDEVPLSRRAFALVDLLDRAAKAKADVLWDRA